MTRLFDRIVFGALFTLSVAVLGTGACDAPFVDAQARRLVRRVPDYVLLARICVSEAGWQCWDTGDGLAIYEVLSNGALRTGTTFRTYARSYASRATGARLTANVRLSWVAQLNEAGERPASWPTGLSWSNFRPQWLDVLETAEEVLTLDGARAREWSPCAGPVHDWGGAMDEARARRLRLIRVECGETLNRFYARPSVVRTQGENP